MNNLRAMVIGRSIGALDLNTLIKAVELEAKGHVVAPFHGFEHDSALKTLKRKLRCKGNRDSVLAFARECLSTIVDW